MTTQNRKIEPREILTLDLPSDKKLEMLEYLGYPKSQILDIAMDLIDLHYHTKKFKG